MLPVPEKRRGGCRDAEAVEVCHCVSVSGQSLVIVVWNITEMHEKDGQYED